MKLMHSWFITYYLILPCLIFAQAGNEASEPSFEGTHSISLIQADTLEGWEVPSDCWSIKDGVITGNTGAEPLVAPEWLYTQARFADFTFTCELRLTGSKHPNSGIYFRVNPIQYKGRKNNPDFEAAAGYEYDVAPGKFCGSLGDWYARPKLRMFVDREIIDRVYIENEWNRMTLRARGNRIEYWLNGVKLMDFVDHDPNGSREGFIGLQIHNNAVMKIEMRKAQILPNV